MTRLVIRTGLTGCGKPGNSTGIRKLPDRLYVNPPEVPYSPEAFPQLTDGWPMLWASP